MSKRCELQKEYYQQYGNYKGSGKYSDHYVVWLENEVLELSKHDVVKSEEIKEICLEIQGAWCEKYNGCKDCPLINIVSRSEIVTFGVFLTGKSVEDIKQLYDDWSNTMSADSFKNKSGKEICPECLSDAILEHKDKYQCRSCWNFWDKL